MLDGIVNYEAFLLSAFLFFAATPGLDTVFVLNKALGCGRKSALAAALGINAGVLVHTVVGALGLSALLAQSAEAFMVVKFAGAAYLIWMGVHALVSKAKPLGVGMKLEGSEPLMKSFRSGLVANVLNPKVALFVLAFLPPFISADAAGEVTPFLVLGASYAGVGVLWYLVLAYVAGSAGAFLRAKPGFSGWLSKVSGAVFILLGLKVAAAEGAD